MADQFTGVRPISSLADEASGPPPVMYRYLRDLEGGGSFSDGAPEPLSFPTDPEEARRWLERNMPVRRAATPPGVAGRAGYSKSTGGEPAQKGVPYREGFPQHLLASMLAGDYPGEASMLRSQPDARGVTGITFPRASVTPSPALSAGLPRSQGVAYRGVNPKLYEFDPTQMMGNLQRGYSALSSVERPQAESYSAREQLLSEMVGVPEAKRKRIQDLSDTDRQALAIRGIIEGMKVAAAPKGGLGAALAGGLGGFLTEAQKAQERDYAEQAAKAKEKRDLAFALTNLSTGDVSRRDRIAQEKYALDRQGALDILGLGKEQNVVLGQAEGAKERGVGVQNTFASLNAQRRDAAERANAELAQRDRHEAIRTQLAKLAAQGKGVDQSVGLKIADKYIAFMETDFAKEQVAKLGHQPNIQELDLLASGNGVVRRIGNGPPVVVDIRSLPAGR